MSKKSSPLVLQVGKYYRTRDGRKVGPLKPGGILGERSIYVFHCTALNRSWTATGRHNEFFSNAPEDLVAEWSPSAPSEERAQELTDGAIVEAFNGLVKAGRVQTAVGRNSYTSLPVECEYRLKPTTRTCTLPDSGYVVVELGQNSTTRVVANTLGVKVGCQEFFDRHLLLNSLKELCQGKCSASAPYALAANRNGISRAPDHHITWADADALLKFLEET